MLDPSIYLQNQGWKVGRGLKENSISRPIPAPRKRNLNGIGRDRDDGHLFHSSLFDAAAKAIQIKIDDSSDEEDSSEGDKDTKSQSLSISRTSTGIISTRTSTPSVPSTEIAFGQAKQSIAKRKLYSRFRQGQTYKGGELQEFLQDNKQRVPVQTEAKKSKKKRKSPDNPYGFAYGSGVFKQTGYSDKDKPLVDFIIAVTHPHHWHSINIQQNPSHYPLGAKLFGNKAITFLQRKFGAQVWYVTMVEVDGIPLKYGVISVDDLCRDLLDWETLYVSGRMHKPVRVIKDDARVKLAQQVNLTSALRTALLLLPAEFSQQELYEKISSLSYSGDPRMTVGENPEKISNIVSAQMEQFHTLYEPLAMQLRGVRFVPGWRRLPQGKRTIRQPMNGQARATLATKLPLVLRNKIKAHFDNTYGDVKNDDSAYWSRVVQDPQFHKTLENGKCDNE
ncbi:hypothetical protein E3Q18_02013 [Wallemia mellicola]|uniref:Phosphatidate cytidylyltransferase, mitochondrial n=1 Tax=Wallemia mellicola TaxID=1708541 RepID=A0A4T0Q1U2_9BASI|nr:hypothetical protein E3Q24_02020 [Wallemia mellicola]TIB76584.1 hypothetical protein E3Q23_01733 [Wallemia mellicola]TIB85226.1 hypothetical protein E3Q21_02053 [Wallemia mellicola]TIB88494.1 hypothetical protein E3Q20_02046 [Wallemia mellicola]TIB98584.1 hypothetical protein E3Q18_02013 [Wallemia mellicola]